MCQIPRILRQPGRSGFAGQFTQDITAADGHAGAGR